MLMSCFCHVLDLPLDIELFRRSDHQTVELAVTNLRQLACWSQPLCHVRHIPPDGGSDCIRLFRPDHQSVGYIRLVGCPCASHLFLLSDRHTFLIHKKIIATNDDCAS